MAHVAAEGKPVDTAAQGAERLLRIEDVAERLAISRSMAWKLIAFRQLRSVRIGRAVRVRPADLEDYLAHATREG